MDGWVSAGPAPGGQEWADCRCSARGLGRLPPRQPPPARSPRETQSEGIELVACCLSKSTRCVLTIWDAAGRFAVTLASRGRARRNFRSRRCRAVGRHRSVVGTEWLFGIVGSFICVTAGRPLAFHAVTFDLDARTRHPRSILRRRPANRLRRGPRGAAGTQGKRNEERCRPDQRSYATSTRRKTGTRQQHGQTPFN